MAIFKKVKKPIQKRNLTDEVFIEKKQPKKLFFILFVCFYYYLYCMFAHRKNYNTDIKKRTPLYYNWIPFWEFVVQT